MNEKEEQLEKASKFNKMVAEDRATLVDIETDARYLQLKDELMKSIADQVAEIEQGKYGDRDLFTARIAEQDVFINKLRAELERNRIYGVSIDSVFLQTFCTFYSFLIIFCLLASLFSLSFLLFVGF